MSCFPRCNYSDYSFYRIGASLSGTSGFQSCAMAVSFLFVFISFFFFVHLGPVVESVVRLTGSSVVKMLTVLVSTISISQVFLLKKI